MKLYRACVYTLVDEEALVAADRGRQFSLPLSENKAWKTATAFLEDAAASGEVVPLLLADASDPGRWLGWAELVSATVRDLGNEGLHTDYTFRNLRPPFEAPRSELEVLNSGKPIPASHAKPYVLCKTPGFLEELAAGDDLPLRRDWLKASMPGSAPPKV